MERESNGKRKQWIGEVMKRRSNETKKWRKEQVKLGIKKVQGIKNRKKNEQRKQLNEKRRKQEEK